MTAIELTVIGLLLAVAWIFPGEGHGMKKDDDKDCRVTVLPPQVFGEEIGCDRLEAMWDDQVAFMKLLQEKRGFPQFPTDISSKQGQKFLKDITHHMMDELFEAGQHLKNSKSHRATLIPEVDREAFKEELVDALKLYFELVIASGITLDELYEAYQRKSAVNVERIRGSY